MDYAFSNTLGMENGYLTGTVTSAIVDGQMKANILTKVAQKENLSLDQVAAIGDGANDRWMLQKAGLGVAYHGKEILRQATTHHLNVCDLRGFGLFLSLPVSKFPESKIKLQPQNALPTFISLENLLQD